MRITEMSDKDKTRNKLQETAHRMAWHEMIGVHAPIQEYKPDEVQ